MHAFSPSPPCGTFLYGSQQSRGMAMNGARGPGRLELLGQTLTTVGCIIMLVVFVIIPCAVLLWFILT